MADLSTSYMGLKLDNPLVVSSSGLTGSVKGVQDCADSGAGAVVLKSMFEELIIAHSRDLDLDILQSEHPEAYEYIRAEIGKQLGPIPYLRFVEDVRKHIRIPVIASINCTSPQWWLPYARDIESAGAHAIELNISHFPESASRDLRDVEKMYARITSELASRVKIPVAVKIGMYFTSIGDVARDIAAAGAKGIVLFNRYYTVDMNIEQKRFVPSMTYSSNQEILLPLRWIGLLAETIQCDIAGSTGIHEAKDVIKMLMAGATVTQLCSVLYSKGIAHLGKIREELDAWLDSHGYKSVADIRGAALEGTGNREMLLHRMQYIKSLEEASKYEG
jgi:dihydroorotate dehydrogenase (fumarate)